MRVNDRKEILELLKRWQKGEEEAYEAIYSYYYKYVYYIAFQFFHNHEKAEDAVQDAFLEAYHKIHTLKELAAFQAWIKQIVYRKCLNRCTYEKKDALSYSRAFSDDNEDDEKLYQEAISIDKIQLEDAIKLVIRKLSELDERKRMIGYLRFLEGYKAREIAEIMAINIETVNTNIRRIKLLLKKELEENHYIPTKGLSLVVLPKFTDIYERLQENTIASSLSSHPKYKSSSMHTILFSIGMIAFSTVMITNKEYISQSILSLKETKIVSVDYSKTVSNKPIVIDVSTNNQNYDDIYINDEKTTTITTNGIYTIAIKKSRDIVDKKQIVITNIDTFPPYIIEKKVEPSTIILYLKDNYGIDYKHIELYQNDQRVDDMQINEEKNCIILPKKVGESYFLKVPDINGNHGEFYVHSYEI